MLKNYLKKYNSTLINVVAPVTGKFLSLDEVPDPVFSSKMVGEGAAVQPELANTIVVSPVKGKVVMLADALHAIGIQDNNGIELLIHIGLDTVDLNGSGFTPFVSVNEEVELGQPIMKVDVSKIEANGKKSVIPLVVTNNENNHYTLVWNKLDTVEAGKTVLFQLKAPNFSP